METAIVSIICIALIVVGGMTMSQGFLSSADSTMVGVEAISVRDGEIMRTELSPLTADVGPAGRTVEVALRNSGQVKLSRFSKWDVIVEYYSQDGTYYTAWLPYAGGTPGDNEWTVEGIYLSAENQTAEVFEPGILSPGEEMVIEARLNPPVKKNTTGDVLVSTPNGVPNSISFTR
jgi:hypothetical protein